MNQHKTESGRGRSRWATLLKGSLIVAVLWGVGWAGSMYYRIGVDPQEVTSISGTWLYVRSLEMSQPSRGDIFAFEVNGLEPIFDDGQLLAKFVRGMPGDCVSVTSEGIFVNGDQVGQGFAAAQRLELDVERFFGERCLEDGEYWMLGNNSESFDSRYFGAVTEDQFRGHVFPLL